MKMRFITALTAAVLLAGCSQSDNSASDITVSATGTSATTTVTTTTAVPSEVTTTTAASADTTTTTEDTTTPETTTAPGETSLISSEGSSGTTSSVSTTSLSSAQTSKSTTTTTTKKVSTTTNKKATTTTTTKKSTTTTTSTTTSKKTSSATQSTKSNKSMITITLNATGGTCSKSSIQVEEGSKIYTLPTATRNGYRFTGWSAWENYNFPLDKNTDGSYNISTYSDKIFYACWNKVHTGIDADADDTCISNCVSYVTGRYHPESYYINIGKNLKNDGTDYDKALQVYKWMRKNGQGNCVDYSVETYLVCKGIGLECIFVHKTSRGFYGHTYNFVKLDGKYYNFDTQGNVDPLGSAGPRCRTFDINDNDITVPAGKSYAQDHGIDGSKVKDDFHV